MKHREHCLHISACLDLPSDNKNFSARKISLTFEPIRGWISTSCTFSLVVAGTHQKHEVLTSFNRLLVLVAQELTSFASSNAFDMRALKWLPTILRKTCMH